MAGISDDLSDDEMSDTEFDSGDNDLGKEAKPLFHLFLRNSHNKDSIADFYMMNTLFALESFQDLVRDHLRRGMKQSEVLETSVLELRDMQ